MKIIIVNTFAYGGGAAIASRRLMFALRKNGVDANMLVRDKQNDDDDTISVNGSPFRRRLNFFRFVWERVVIWVNNGFSRKNLFTVSIADTGMDISKCPEVLEADVIHLHWINQGFLSLKNIQELVGLGKPIVWTMHDMWPCTAICHLARTCTNFKSSCNNCPYLKFPGKHDLSARVWKKKRFLNESRISFVTVSSWLQTQVRESSLTNRLSVSVIPNTLDLSVFYPRNREEARQRLQILPTDNVIVLGACKLDDPLKGFDFLLSVLALSNASEMGSYLLVLFGNIKGDKHEFFRNMPCRYRYMGGIETMNELAEIYSAADITVVPSDYETFGQTIIESMACGVPVVTFGNSGQKDIITHKQDGYLAEYKNKADFLQGIRWCLTETGDILVKENIRNKVACNYSEDKVAEKYITLYQALVDKNND